MGRGGLPTSPLTLLTAAKQDSASRFHQFHNPVLDMTYL
jgi:hypothetical protein